MADKKVIEGTDVTASQLKELFSAISLGRITRQSMQGFLENPGKFAAAQNPTATFLAADYFTIRSGLWVSDDFTSRITQAYPEALVSRGLDGVESFDLEHSLYDKDIVFCMRGEDNVRKYAFTPDQVGALIDLQPHGKPGRLLNDGYANRFLMIGIDGVVFVVRVRLDIRDCNWNVVAWKREEVGSWHAGDRVFRNTRTF